MASKNKLQNRQLNRENSQEILLEAVSAIRQHLLEQPGNISDFRIALDLNLSLILTRKALQHLMSNGLAYSNGDSLWNSLN